MQVPILIIGDAPDQTTGLGRVVRDLATLLASMPEFRVATLGLGMTGSRQFPWSQYAMSRYPNGNYEFGELTLPRVWEDFAGGQIGIVFTVMDLSRLLWLARPEHVQDENLRGWLEDARGKRFKLWSYLPIDSLGPDGRLTTMSRETLMGIDRVLAYTPWARDVVIQTIGEEEAVRRGVDWLPHMLNTQVFKPEVTDAPTDRDIAALDPLPVSGGSDPVADEAGRAPVRIGVVATNQARKDWGLAAEVSRGLADRIPEAKFWWHVDTLIRHWNIYALIQDFGLGDKVSVTTPPMDDRGLAHMYRMCDLTLHFGLGEGFGLPIFESLACGVPAIHGDYAGGASIMRTCGLERYLVSPWHLRLDTQHNCYRPVFHPDDWVEKAVDILSIKPDAGWLRSRVEHLSSKKLGYVWQRWFRDGLGYTQ